MYITPNEYSRPQKPLKKVRGLVIHWYADPMASAMAVRNFFENRKKGKSGYGSAQYNIGLLGEVIQSLPENEMAYAVGSKTYTQKALNQLSSYPNDCTLNIECAHVDWQGRMTDATYFSLIELTVDIMKRHGLSITDLWLHQEVVGWKDCHRWFVNNKSEWIAFKNQINQLLAKQVNPIVKSEIVEYAPPVQTPNKPNRDADVLYLPPTSNGVKNESWAMYKLDREPKRIPESNILLELNPYKFNGLKYEILGEHPKYPNVVKIKSQQKGEGWVYVGSETGAKIIKGEVKPVTPPKPIQEEDSADGKLTRGEKGSNVKLLNQMLNTLEYTRKTDDIFDQYTEAALKAFQKDHGLKQDAIYTSAVGKVMIEAIALKKEKIEAVKLPEKNEEMYRLAKLVDTKNKELVKKMQEAGYVVIDTPEK
jgi:N-acetylmuramoyl-L-alanine amidase CwlA